MARISIPTTARLPSTLRLDPANTTVLKVLSRLSRPSLLTLVLDWLDDVNAPICAPYLRTRRGNGSDDGDDDDDDDDVDPTDLYPPLPSLEALRDLYTDMQTRKGSKRELLDRILEGDWRQGLTLYQLSMADLQYLYDHPGSQKWSAYRVVPLKTPTPREAAEDDNRPLRPDAESLVVPRFHPSTFLASLQAQVLPDVKAHYNFDRPRGMPLLLLRIFIMDSPYNTNLATVAAASSSSSSAGVGNGRKKAATATAFDASRTIYAAFPDGSPYIYLSKLQTVGPVAAGETRSLRALVVEGIPKALSRPRERFGLRPTSLVTRNLDALLHARGPGRNNTAAAGWGIYADERKKESPLDAVLPSPPLSEGEDGRGAVLGVAAERGEESRRSARTKRVAPPGELRDQRRAKRARLVAQARFGDSARMDDGKGIERVDIVIDDPFSEAPGSAVEEDAEAGDDDAAPIDRPRGGTGRRSTMDEAFSRARGQDDGGGEEEDAEEGGEETWRPSVKLTFHGSHVFAGIRQLVEAGIISGEEMPGWLTGEEGVTIGAVRHGRIRGHKGSGI